MYSYIFIYICLYSATVPLPYSQVDRDAVSTASEIKASAVEEVLSDQLIYIYLFAYIHIQRRTHIHQHASIPPCCIQVDRDAVSTASEIKASAVEEVLPAKVRCVLADFFAPFNSELAHLLSQYSYSPVTHTWENSGEGCPQMSAWRLAR